MKQPPNITQLQHKLRKGANPEDWNLRVLGAGVEKTAYQIDFVKVIFLENDYTKPFKQMVSYVVKLNESGGYIEGPKKCPDLTDYDVQKIYQIQAGKYVIQELTTVLGITTTEQYPDAWAAYDKLNSARRNGEIRGDFHTNNMGVRPNGELVCFDW